MKGLSRVIAALGIMGFVFFGLNQVSAQEKNPFEKAIEDRYNAMDANKDGKISYEEYTAAYEKSIKASFEKRDKNSDGVLTKEEFMPKMQGFKMKSGANPFQNMPQKPKDAGQQN